MLSSYLVNQIYESRIMLMREKSWFYCGKESHGSAVLIYMFSGEDTDTKQLVSANYEVGVKWCR